MNFPMGNPPFHFFNLLWVLFWAQEALARDLKIGFLYEGWAKQLDEYNDELSRRWNREHSSDLDMSQVRLSESTEYGSENGNPFQSLQKAIKLVEQDYCHVIVGVTNCQSAIALKSWSESHKVPLIMLPMEICVQVSPQTFPSLVNESRTSLVMASPLYEFHLPAFDLAQIKGFNRVIVIMDLVHYTRLYVETNAVSESFKSLSFFVYKMDEVSNFFEEDANVAGHDNFVILGDLNSCREFFSQAGDKSPIMKIRVTWIISCKDLTVENFKLLNTSMATMYLITPDPGLALDEDNRQNTLKHTIEHVTQTIAESYGAIPGLVAPTKLPIEFYDGDTHVDTWQDGERLMGKIKEHFKGEDHLEHSHRNLFNVFFLDIENKTWSHIGNWDRQNRLSEEIMAHQTSFHFDPMKSLKIVTVEEEPFVSIEKTPNGDVPYGYCIELLNEIMYELGIQNYTVEVLNQYGKLIDNKWDGAVGEVVYNRADMAVSGMIITSARQDVVDFSSRYMDYSVGILIKKSEQKDNGFGFLNPLELNVWTSFCALIFAVGLLMYALTRISPSAERINELSGYTDLSKFNLRNSIWFMISSIMMQGVDIQPATPSGRIIGTFWWFFSLTVTAMYTANLAAFLTVNRMETPIDSLQSLAYQNKISYGTVINSPVHTDFKEQAGMIPLYERIYATLINENSPNENLVATAEQGFKKVLTGTYAFMWDDAILQWKQTIHCEYMTVGKPFMNKGYGIAMKKGSPLKKNISSSILHLQEKGTLEKLRQKWFLNATECVTGTKATSKDESQDPNTKGIDMSSVKGIFLTLIFGVCLSIFTVASEIWLARTFHCVQRETEGSEENEGGHSREFTEKLMLSPNHNPGLFNNYKDDSDWKRSIQYSEVRYPVSNGGVHHCSSPVSPVRMRQGLDDGFANFKGGYSAENLQYTSSYPAQLYGVSHSESLMESKGLSAENMQRTYFPSSNGFAQEPIQLREHLEPLMPGIHFRHIPPPSNVREDSRKLPPPHHHNANATLLGREKQFIFYNR